MMEADLEAFTKKYDEEMWAKQNQLEALNKNLDFQNNHMTQAQVRVQYSTEYMRKTISTQSLFSTDHPPSPML
jgi:hypothetical protein